VAAQSDDFAHELELTTERLGAALDAFAGILPERDRRVLITLLLRSVDPIDRVRLLSPELLSEEQEALLAAIETEG
jgi:hypothetical protein